LFSTSNQVKTLSQGAIQQGIAYTIVRRLPVTAFLPLVQLLKAYPQANHYTMTTPLPSPSNTSQANKNMASTITPTMNKDYTKTVNVKKVPFDGTEA
jgi:hypothetical protein